MKEIEPLVSVLVPVYNVELYIEKCARSLFDQTYKNIEYIFVDDCSPDDSISVLEATMAKYPRRKAQVRVIRQLSNSGIANVRNVLIANAKGKYVLFIDSDDWVESTMVEDFVAKAESTDADIVCGNCYHEFETGSAYYDFYPRSGVLGYLEDISCGLIKTYLWLLFTKRELYVTNELSFISGINVSEDYIMYNKLFFHAKKVEHLAVAYYHYYRGNANSYTVLSLRNVEDRIAAIGVVEQYLKSNEMLCHLSPYLNRRKFETKKEFIVNLKLRDFARWRATFPESNYSWKGSNIGRFNKLMCVLVSWHLDKVAGFLQLKRGS